MWWSGDGKQHEGLPQIWIWTALNKCTCPLPSLSNYHQVARCQGKRHKSAEVIMQLNQTFKAGYYLAQLSLDCGHESSAKALICDVIKRQSLARLHWQRRGEWLCGHTDSILRRVSEERELQPLFQGCSDLKCVTLLTPHPTPATQQKRREKLETECFFIVWSFKLNNQSNGDA